LARQRRGPSRRTSRNRPQRHPAVKDGDQIHRRLMRIRKNPHRRPRKGRPRARFRQMRQQTNRSRPGRRPFLPGAGQLRLRYRLGRQARAISHVLKPVRAGQSLRWPHRQPLRRACRVHRSAQHRPPLTFIQRAALLRLPGRNGRRPGMIPHIVPRIKAAHSIWSRPRQPSISAVPIAWRRNRQRSTSQPAPFRLPSRNGRRPGMIPHIVQRIKAAHSIWLRPRQPSISAVPIAWRRNRPHSTSQPAPFRLPCRNSRRPGTIPHIVRRIKAAHSIWSRPRQPSISAAPIAWRRNRPHSTSQPAPFRLPNKDGSRLRKPSRSSTPTGAAHFNRAPRPYPPAPTVRVGLSPQNPLGSIIARGMAPHLSPSRVE